LSLIREVTCSDRRGNRGTVHRLRMEGSRQVADYLFPIGDLGTMVDLQVLVIHQPPVTLCR